MILIIDNYDSFVFNLARMIQELNFDCLVKRNDAITLAQIQREIKPSHIILSPGPCTPDQAGICLAVVKELGCQIPILGVCLGHQVIAQAFGATIMQARKPLHGKATLQRHDGCGLFQGLPNPLKVCRYHSLVASPITFPACLHVNAWSAEGEIMALQHQQWPLFGVQFHPESILTQDGYLLLKNFCELLQAS